MIRRTILTGAALLALTIPATAFAGLHAGDMAPNFRGTDLNGVSHTLLQYRGKVVLLFVMQWN